MVGYLLRNCARRPTAMLNKAMPTLINAKTAVGRQFLTYEEARAGLLEAGVPPEALNYLRHYSAEEVEAHRRQAEAEAQRQREAIARGETIEADYSEITE